MSTILTIPSPELLHFLSISQRRLAGFPSSLHYPCSTIYNECQKLSILVQTLCHLSKIFFPTVTLPELISVLFCRLLFPFLHHPVRYTAPHQKFTSAFLHCLLSDCTRTPLHFSLVFLSRHTFDNVRDNLEGTLLKLPEFGSFIFTCFPYWESIIFISNFRLQDLKC